MKKLISVLLSISIIASTSLTAVYANDDISVILEGKELEFDVASRIVDESTMVPMRKIFEELGYYVAWNPTTKAIVATNGSNKLFMTINDKKMYFNDEEKELAVAPTIIEDTTFVPLRAISEAGGYNVVWDDQTRSVHISTEKIVLPQQHEVFSKLKSVIVGCGNYNEDFGYVLSSLCNDGSSVEIICTDNFAIFAFITNQENQKRVVNLIIESDCANIFTVKFTDSGEEDGTLFVGYYNGLDKKVLKHSDEINNDAEVQTMLRVAFNAYDEMLKKYGSTVTLADFDINCHHMDDIPIEAAPVEDSDENIVEKTDGVYYYNALSEVEQVKELIKNKQYSEAIELCDRTTRSYDLSPEDKETFEYLRKYAKEQYMSQTYYNALDKVEQVKEYINNGLYIEAYDLCEDTLRNYNLSPDDVEIFESLLQTADSKYNEYVAEASKWKQFYYSPWGLGYTCAESPEFIRAYGDGGGFRCYRAFEPYREINIFSFKLGSVRDSGILTSNLKNSAVVLRERFDYVDLNNSSFEILSSNYTTAGNLNAYQETYRISEYKNRYHTKADYRIARHIVFQYGDWIYLIEATQSEYLWSEDFYEILEKIRTTICFY